MSPGLYILTISGLTLGGSESVALDFAIQVATNNDLSGSGGCPQIGGSVRNVAMSIAAVDRVPGATGRAVTVSFTTATPLVKDMKVTLKWPPGYLSGANIAVTYAGTPQTFVPNAVPLTPQNDGVLITVDSAGAPNASYVITLTGMTMPTALTAANSESTSCGALKFDVSTTADFSGQSSTIMFGGQVSRHCF